MIATILLLAITVTLFTAIFFFIQDFPKPAPHSVSQFSAFIGYRAGSSAIVSVTIDHLAGPAVSGTTSKQAAIYIASENRSNTWGPFLLSQGLPNAATNWVFGQAWNCTSACAGFPSLFAPDNLTIKLISGGGLLFEDSIRAVFPGFAPYFQRASVAPTSGGTFHSASPTTFSVAATVVCSVSCQVTNPVLLNYSEFVGKASPSVAMACTPPGGAVENCWYNSTTVKSPPTAGTYYLFLTATDTLGRTDTFTITVSIT